MSVALAGQSPTTFEIKSASLPLLALRLKSADLGLLADELQAQYGDMPNFFEDDAVVLDLSALAEDQASAAIDFTQIGELLHARRLRLLAVRGGNDGQCAAARQLGLLLAPDARVQAAPRPPDLAPTAAAVTPDAASAELPAPGALIIDRPLRSGQQVYARGRDLVLLAMVNAGAEVVADGHIHVYAPLRGRAIAGARGWPEARILAREMRPELVSIAGIYRASDEPLPPEVWGRPASVRLQSTDAGDKLIFEPIPD
ncbi:septum site-determining protein MinC [Ottowia testudinis]|uniref:Probable septum site-determining protein MinC n=1 Tax=Ottowia testudinis TaxID=2816950 RepID=A0A975H328_9BURK|nr:septum site-determining protein MinC [Ottowia testudinis]QTD45468.1 septum site-determining protein MinC [Ottowia testudinis]